jgi:integrase
MARLPKDSMIMTREARSRLDARKQPYWKQIVPGLFVGYVKQRRVNTWTTKRLVAGKYIWERLGSADDFMAADGEVVLSYRQAVTAAQDRATALRGAGPRYHGDGVTVDAALDRYFTERHGANATSHAIGSDELAAARYIRPVFGHRLVSSLSDAELRHWQLSIANALPTVRGKGAGVRKAREVDLSDPAVRRKRNNTTNRVWSVLRAALTLAWREPRNGIASRDAWERIKPLKVDSLGPPRMLELGEIRRLLDACTADFRPLLEAGLMTGARYGELVGLRVRDYDVDQQTVRIHQGKTGKTLYQPLTSEGARFFESVTRGKPSESLMFTRADGEPWGKSHQARPMSEAAGRAGLSDLSFKVTRATYGKLLLQVTQDIELVAKALGHSDSRITRKHYAQYLPNEVALALQKMPTLGVDISNVHRFSAPPRG